jgi:hypothetical protein
VRVLAQALQRRDRELDISALRLRVVPSVDDLLQHVSDLSARDVADRSRFPLTLPTYTQLLVVLLTRTVSQRTCVSLTSY